MRVNLGLCEGCLLISLLTDWKKKGNQYKKYRPISGHSYFIRKGAFYLERRRESRGWAISSIFFSRSYLQKFFFFRDNCTSIFIAFYHSPRIHKFSYIRVIDLSTSSNSCCIIFFLIYGVNLHGLLIWNWFQIHSKSVTSHKL